MAGVSGSGKSSFARVIGRIYRVPVHEVEARECWSIMPGLGRQECFARAFIDKMEQGAGVYTNHLLTVYGYTAAMLGSEHPLARRLKNIVERRGDPVIVLVVGRGTLEERIVRRLETDSQRSTNTTETNIKLHLNAQKHILDYARQHSLPTISMV